MKYKKKGKLEKEIRRLERQISQVDDQADNTFKQAKDLADKGDPGKSTQMTTRWAILIDKRKSLAADLERLMIEAPEGEDLVLKFSLETGRLFYRWLVIFDKNYLRWIWLTVFHKDEATELLKICEGKSPEQMAKDLGDKAEEHLGKCKEEMTGNLEDIEGGEEDGEKKDKRREQSD